MNKIKVIKQLWTMLSYIRNQHYLSILSDRGISSKKPKVASKHYRDSESESHSSSWKSIQNNVETQSYKFQKPLNVLPLTSAVMGDEEAAGVSHLGDMILESHGE